MRFEKKFRLGVLAGAMLVLPGLAVPMAAPAQDAPPAHARQDGTDDYQWIDQADSLWDAIGDAPPDYAFSFEDEQPWAWQTQDGYTIVVEDAGEGGIRSYYFAPGADGPFLAVEPGMSFGYDGDRVAMVYGPDGGAMDQDEGGQYVDQALNLYDRGRALRDAMGGEPQQEVDAGAWVDASPYIFTILQLWDEGRSRYPGWGRYHNRADSAAWRRRFEAEQRRRRGLSDAFHRWRDGGFQGRPPGRFHPPGQGHGGRQPGQWHGGQHRPGGHPPRTGSGTPPPLQPGATAVPRIAPPPRTAVQGNGMPPRRPGAGPDAPAGANLPTPPQRPGRWPRGPRPDAGTPQPSVEAPVQAVPGAAPAVRPRPPRPEGGWQGGPRRPMPPMTRPAPTSDSGPPPPSRPAPVMRRDPGESYRPAPQRSFTPSPAARAPSPAPRSYAPPPQRSAPAPRSAPPPRSSPPPRSAPPKNDKPR